MQVLVNGCDSEASSCKLQCIAAAGETAQLGGLCDGLSRTSNGCTAGSSVHL